MKRAPELAELSREHHQALALALALRRTTSEHLDRDAARYVAFLADHDAGHFAVEEAVLVPVLPDDMAERLLREHDELRDATAELADVAGVRRAGELLAAHVRFEERVVFPHLEEQLAPAELAAMGRRLAAG